MSTLPLFNAEYRIAERLRDHGHAVAIGATPDESREFIRAAIVDNGKSMVIVGRGADRKPVTYAQAFEAAYGQPLIASARKARAKKRAAA